MEPIVNTLYTFIAFIMVISIVVFIHEFGHFYFARLFGVRVEKFSIGFGKAIFKWRDSKKTEWQISAVPMGGYVKMYGDSNPASTPDSKMLAKMSKAQKAASFHYKPRWQKSIVIAAGPLFNYLSAILITAFLLYSQGMIFLTPKISSVLPNTPASEVGLLEGDTITRIDNNKITNFLELKDTLAMSRGAPLNLTVKRDEKIFDVKVTPIKTEISDGLGKSMSVYSIGITATDIQIKKLGFFESLKYGIYKVHELNSMMIQGIYQMISGDRGAEEISGPIKIAQYSAKSLESGLYGFLSFIVMISVNLGLVNLLPIPLLDGGHLAVYAAETIIQKPIDERTLQKANFIGFMIIIFLMMYGISNDLRSFIG